MITDQTTWVFPAISLEGVSGILLDLDNTLYPYDVCHEKALRASYDLFCLRIPLSFEDFVAKYKRANNITKKNASPGSIRSRFLYFQYLLEDHFGHTAVELTCDLERIYWNSFFNAMVLDDGVAEFFAECDMRGIPVCLLTDLTARIQFEKLKCLKIEKFIKYVVSSEEVGVEKPDRKMFDLALTKLGISAESALMIGDDFDKDILGAKNLGIRTMHVLRNL